MNNSDAIDLENRCTALTADRDRLAATIKEMVENLELTTGKAASMTAYLDARLRDHAQAQADVLAERERADLCARRNRMLAAIRVDREAIEESVREKTDQPTARQNPHEHRVNELAQQDRDLKIGEQSRRIWQEFMDSLETLADATDPLDLETIAENVESDLKELCALAAAVRQTET